MNPSEQIDALIAAGERATSGEWESSGDALPPDPPASKRWKTHLGGGNGASVYAGDATVVSGGAQDEQGGEVGFVTNEDALFACQAANAREAIKLAHEIAGKLSEAAQTLHDLAESEQSWQDNGDFAGAPNYDLANAGYSLSATLTNLLAKYHATA